MIFYNKGLKFTTLDHKKKKTVSTMTCKYSLKHRIFLCKFIINYDIMTTLHVVRVGNMIMKITIFKSRIVHCFFKQELSRYILTYEIVGRKLWCSISNQRLFHNYCWLDSFKNRYARNICDLHVCLFGILLTTEST